MARRRSATVDVLDQVRRALRILRRVEKYLLHVERAEARAAARRGEDYEMSQLPPPDDDDDYQA